MKTYTDEQAGRKWVAFEKDGKYYEEYFEYFSGGGWRSYGITEICKETYEEFNEN